MSQEIVTINGVNYDAQSGLPIATAAKAAASTPVTFTPYKQSRPSQSVHATTEKSHTLNRRIVKKATPTVAAMPAAGISKFAPHPSAMKKPVKMIDFRAQRKSVPAPTIHAPKSNLVVAPVKSAVSPSTRPTTAPVTMTESKTPVVQTNAATPSQIIKQQEIEKALATPAKKESKRRKLAKKTNKHSRVMSIASASLALLLLGGYFTYLNMPSLSVRVAAAQAGVDATYPAYRPDGYSVNGLVTYSEGAVSMKFAANGGPQSFTIDQTKKNWDSSAVLENYVKPKSGGNYIPYSEQGLTVYTFDNNAAWVNKGVLYTISGDAPLSSDQILHIASSM
ncbi:MAG: DUF4367 domain-containing protein [Candidatus Saccharimonadales bacterium]